MTQHLVLIGCGTVFETIASTWPQLSSGLDDLKLIRLASTDQAAVIANEQLPLFNPSETIVFAAVDENAMNYARLEIYGRARILGFKSKTLIHPSAMIAIDSKIGENCWIGAGAVISSGVSIGNNTFIGAQTRLDYGVNISANCWVGPGSAIGNATSIGQHVTIGSDIIIGAAITIGRHCVIDIPGAYLESFTEGTFIDTLFPSSARIYASKPTAKISAINKAGD
ncbi:MAG: DapH/DapD/GlmU-related protein [Methylophilaceae bacterium]